MKDEGNNKGNENRGGRDKEEPVSNLKCPAQHFRHSAETEGGSRPGNTIVQYIVAVNTLRSLYITTELHQWSV